MSDKLAGKGKQTLAFYGSKDDLEHLAGRIRRCVPGGMALKIEEALALAQVSLSTGFDPFIGEIWYIPGRGPMVGIRGYRNRAKAQSTYSLHFRAMTQAEIDEHEVRVDIGDVGRICELYHHTVLQNALAINKAVDKALIPIEPIIGVGIWRKAWPEMGQKKNDTMPHGKSPMWVAEKRAEADALNKGFDITVLPYSDEVGMRVAIANGLDVIEAETVQREVIANAERVANAEKTKSAADHANDLFGDEQPTSEIESVSPPEDTVKETSPDPVEETFPEPVVGSEEKDPFQILRAYAEEYNKKDKDLAPTGGQLKLLGALCVAVSELGLPRQSLFTLRSMVWGEGNFLRSQFHALLRYVCELDDEGSLAKTEDGGFPIKEEAVRILTPLLGAEIPSDQEDLPF